MSKSTVAFLISIAIIVAIGMIVLAAISVNALGWLIVGVIVLSLFALGLSHFGVKLLDGYTDAVNKRDAQRHDYHISVLRLGYQPIGATYIALMPPADYEPDIPVSIAGVSPQALMEYRADAQNLVALSKQLISIGKVKRNDQIAPYHKARSSEYFRDVKVWMHAIQYLMANQLAKEEKNGEKHLGTFCMAGTVEQLYERLRPPTG